ncbi:hypothetical protein A8V41_12480 [Klebsiella pneumoniae]|nr:hypothetical protein A8V41_12480 [Klebsiella pneumoniae]
MQAYLISGFLRLIKMRNLSPLYKIWLSLLMNFMKQYQENQWVEIKNHGTLISCSASSRPRKRPFLMA